MSWIVPKTAEPGDDALFVFNRDLFVGSGIVDSEREPDTFLGRPAFRADVRDLRQFKRPLSVDEVAKRIPEWNWPRSYTKGRTSPAEPISRKLNHIIEEHVSQVGIIHTNCESPGRRQLAVTDAPPPRWAEVVPERLRTSAARVLARSIREAHALHPACWTVTLGSGFVRLNVGVPLALTLKSNLCELIVMRDAPEMSELHQLGVEMQGGFAKAPGTVWVTFPLRSLEEVHRRLWSGHASALRVAVGRQGATPHTGYSHELIAYLRSLGLDVPDSECAGALEVRRALGEEIPGPVFDPHNLSDGREYDRRAILRRQGQPAFRLALLRAYDGKCAVTGCDVAAVLQAAHIIPYRGSATDCVENGLLLRADIHDLFDLGKLEFDEEWRVRIHEDLRGTHYEELEGRLLRLPRDQKLRPSLEALRVRLRGRLPLGGVLLPQRARKQKAEVAD